MDNPMGISYPFVLTLFLVSILMQTTLLGRISFWGLKPELHIILASYFLLRLPWGAALTAVLALGIIIDVYSLTPFGLTPLTFLITAAALNRTKEVFSETGVLTWLMLVGAATIFSGFLQLAATLSAPGFSVPIPGTLGRLMLLVVINTALGAFLFPFLFRTSGERKGINLGGGINRAGGSHLRRVS